MSKPLRALIVEDSPDDAALLLRELRRGGYEVVSEIVETPHDMNAALDQRGWDVVFSDYSMPRFSGPDALEILKQKGVDIPFIMVSGTVGEDTAVDAMKTGAQDYMVKGKLARLVPALERELREAQIRRERHQAEEALRESEERFRQIAETIDEVFWISTADLLKVLYVSPAFERVWGREIASLDANPALLLESIHPEDRERVQAEHARRQDSDPFELEYRIVRPDGAVSWIWDRGFPVRDSAGKVKRYVGVAVDVTDRKHTEAENARLANVVNSSEDAIFSINRHEAVVTWNAGAEHVYGYTAEEIKGKHFAILIPEELRSTLTSNRVKLYGGESVLHYENENLRKDGSRIKVSLTLSPIKNPAGTVTGVSVIARDITETKKLEQQLRQSQKMEAIGQLTGGVAHDFNNLLGVIIGNLDLLERQVGTNEAALKRLKTAQKAALRGADLTKRLLAFSSQQNLNPAPTRLDACIQNLAEMASRVLGPEIKITTNVEKSLPPVLVDAPGLENVLLNLAVNARDAMPSGGSLTIAAGVRVLEENYPPCQAREIKPGKYAVLTVSDTGTGMSRETLQRAFEPFFTTKPRGKGTGLGLAMVYGFAKQSGGSVRIYSEPGHGTTVSLYLPFAEDARVPAPADSQQSQPANATGTMLVVDDEAGMLEVAVAYAESMGFRVLQASSGPTALEVAAREPDIELLVTDVIMPGGMNGVELARKTRQLLPSLKVVYSSGFPADALAERSGANVDGPLLTKPYLRSEFVATINQVMTGARLGPRDAGVAKV